MYHPLRVIGHAEEAALIGLEFTTFSLIGRCERTGMFGIAIATSEMAVGSRCIHVAPGVGAIVIQASTNPRLGHLGLNILRAGYSAPRVLEEIVASDQFVTAFLGGSPLRMLNPKARGTAHGANRL
jgi:hypothetical protein